MGDDVTIYLFEPYSEKGKSELTIKRVVHAYKNLFYSEVNFGFGGSLKGCHNDIKCYRDWSNESNAVALVILGDGDKTCSGSLLMNTAHDFKPYFLSAFHCVDIEVPYGGDLSASEVSNAENWMFRFHYKLSSCGGNSPTTRIAYNGATLRAAWDETDFVLLELDHMPHGDSRFSWLGWDRSGNVPSSGTGIHHPAGDVMKISFGSNLYSYNHPITWNYQTTSDVNTHWSIRFDDGGAEGGSSGSPLLDQNRRVVGQLHGGSFTCAPVTKYYGKFDRSWTGGGTHTTRLSNWLDPNNSGDLTIGTPEISAMEIVKYMGVDNCIISNSSNPGDNYYVIQNLGGGTVEVENVYGALIYPMGSNNPQQTVVTPGIFRLEVDPLYNGTDVQIRVRAQEYYGWSVWKNFTFDICQNGYYLSLSPNPSTFGTTISLESPSESARSVATAEAVDVEWELEVYDQNQRLITCKQKLNGKNVTLDTSGWNKGVYIIRATVNEEVIVGKLIIQ